jgi:endothelin-converting enzyme
MILRQVLESATEAQAAGVRSTFLTSRSNAEENNFDMLRTGWKACMDTEAIAAAGIKPLSDFIVTINQSWPVSPDDLDTKVSASDYDGMFKAALLLEEVGITAWHAFCAAETGPALPDPLNSVCRGACHHRIFPTLAD